MNKISEHLNSKPIAKTDKLASKEVQKQQLGATL